MNQCNKFGRKLRILSLCFVLLAAVTVFAVTPFAFAEDQTVSDEAAAEEGSAGILEEEPFIPPVSFTNVAPFGDPVQGTAPAYAVQAADENGETNDGMQLKKTATANDDGTYTIKMEAYATGSKIISEVSKDVPTDIVLVLDQSGSMANNFSKEYFWTSRGTHTNSQNYNSKNNLWYQLSDGSYVKVTVTRSGKNNSNYTYTYTYTDANGQSVTLETSTGASTNCQTVFYQRSNTTRDVTRLEALKNAVTSFVNSVNRKALGADGQYGTEDDIAHRIAIVGFASNSSNNNTELLSTGNVTDYWSANNASYSDALVSACGTNGNVNPRLLTAIDRLSANGDTYLEYGMDMANKIFVQYPITAEDTSGRQRVVVVFTDGYPAPYNTNDFNYSMANSAIQNANASKQTYGATVYTVGVFSTADPAADIETNFAASDGWNNNSNSNNLTEQQEAVAANRYMHYVSSNFPGATSLNQGGSMNPNANPFAGGDSYYLSAADANDLNNIFKQISENVESGGTSSTLTSSSVVKDVISPYFTLPEGASENNITLETYDCIGKDDNGGLTWGSAVTPSDVSASIKDSQVSVTGFDFSKNWCGSVQDENGETTYQGKKLVISFKVKAKPGFLGGNNVPTNAGAGIYADGEAKDPVRSFNEPTVNVPIPNITVSATDKNVYLLGSIGTDALYNGATITADAAGEEVSLNLSKANDADRAYGLEWWQTAFVNIETSITNEDGEVLTSDLQGLTDDMTYRVNAIVGPKENPDGASGAAAAAKTSNDTAKINVFKPEVTFKDSQIYLGQTADYNDNQVDNGVVWKHGDLIAGTNGVAMIGEAPALAYEYSPEAGAFMEDTNVKVTVKIGSDDVTSHVSFKRTDLSGNTTDVANTDDSRTNFIVYVKGFELRIEKTGAQAIDENQSFIFNVEKQNDDGTWSLVTQAVVLGNRYVTITELPIGTYRVTEDENWSWRYKLQNVTGGVFGDMQPFANQVIFTGEENEFSKTLIFTNERTKTKWLNGSAFCQNYWTKDENGNWKVEQRIFPNQENNQNN